MQPRGLRPILAASMVHTERTSWLARPSHQHAFDPSISSAHVFFSVCQTLFVIATVPMSKRSFMYCELRTTIMNGACGHFRTCNQVRDPAKSNKDHLSTSSSRLHHNAKMFASKYSLLRISNYLEQSSFRNFLASYAAPRRSKVDATAMPHPRWTLQR